MIAMKDLVSPITVMAKMSKTVRSKYGEFEVNVPQDRQNSFEPQVLPKRQKDISLIDDKIIAMYAKGNDHTADFRNDRRYLWI